MPLYEHIYIARQELSPTQVETLTNELQEIVTSNGGNVKKHEYWGLRTMQYKINKNRKGHYTLMHFDAPAPAVIEMERQMRINEDILRHFTLKCDTLDSEPSAPLKKDEERGDRRPRRH